MDKLDLIEVVGVIVRAQDGLVEAMAAGDAAAMAVATLRLAQEAQRQFLRLSAAGQGRVETMAVTGGTANGPPS